MKRSSGTTRKNGTLDKLNPGDAVATKASTSVASRPSSQAEAKPSTDDIRRRAYEIYLNRQSTGRPGSSETDWSQAERELAASR